MNEVKGIRYAVLNENKQVVSDLYSRKGDAKRYRNKWNYAKKYTIATLEIVLIEEEK